MSDDQFTKLFKYIQSFRAEVNERLDEKASQDSVDRLTNTMDSFIKRLENTEVDQAARDAQFNRLLMWAREVSARTGVPLKEL